MKKASLISSLGLKLFSPKTNYFWSKVLFLPCIMAFLFGQYGILIGGTILLCTLLRDMGDAGHLVYRELSEVERKQMDEQREEDSKIENQLYYQTYFPNGPRNPSTMKHD